jgi:hypothetical protein
MSTLHQTINSLASEFAHSLLKALRNASLDEIIAETASGHASGARRRGRPAAAAHTGGGGGARRGGGRRLRRRSAGDIGAVVSKIVSMLKSHKKGLRAEEIRAKLGLDRREIPRPLAEALKKKLVTKKGKKRATTYYA